MGTAPRDRPGSQDEGCVAESASVLALRLGSVSLKVSHDRKQVKDAPSIGTDGELPAGDEEAIFRHYGLTHQPGANGERLLARR